MILQNCNRIRCDRIRVVGDVHGDDVAFARALATARFVIQLGDLVDGGPASGACLRMAIGLQRGGRGLFLLGNHELKLLRALLGRKVHMKPELAETMAQIDPSQRAETITALRHAPAWVRIEDLFFVHAGFHMGMLREEAPIPVPLNHTEGLLGRALFGQVTGRTQPDGYPERLLHWAQDIPAGLTCYVGHDRRSTDGRPWILDNPSGGRAVFVDTGCGKGGHLSWLDLQL